jgi:transcription-repair coupling factor (superfamily II helicase)
VRGDTKLRANFFPNESRFRLMTLLALTRILTALEPLADLRNRSESVRASGLLQAARPAVIAALSEGSHDPVLVLTSHAQAAHELAEELRQWTNRRVTFFPALESLPYERVRMDRAAVATRETVAAAATRGHVDIVVAPIRAILQPISRPGAADNTLLTIEQGQRVSIDSVLTRLVERGYSEVGLVEEAGAFARRGGVVDVFPAGADSPTRMEFFGNEVESLRFFDPVTQRSSGAAESLLVQPMASLTKEVRISALGRLLELDTSSMNAEARTMWLDDLARLEAGATIDDVAVFAPYLMSEPCSLVELFPAETTVYIDSAQQSWTLIRELYAQACEVQAGLETSGNVPPGLMPPLKLPDEIEESVRRRRCIELAAGTENEGTSLDLSGLFTPAHLYAGRLRAFQQDLDKRASRVTVVASQQHERLRELLAEINAPLYVEGDLNSPPEDGVTLVHSPAGQGWVLPSEGVTFITDHEIFGRALTRPVVRKPRRAREAFFTDFSPGDYVVHLEHGIGRFDGVTRMAIEGAEREYALVQYAGSDRVYVPTDQLERLTRYVGSGESKPQLSKLGGGEWQRARQRARAAAADIARELIELYARRRTRPAHAFSEDMPWQSELENSFPYPETPDQLRAVEDVKADMEAPHPMDRLVCADVGYGKTEIAVRAAFKAVMDGKQVAVLVPTTILAQQHFDTFAERFAAFPIQVEALSRFRSPAQQREILAKAASGELDVLIGTHRLLQKDVRFKNLGLLIVDEEQRFGVKHKEHLKRMRESIDVLTLTATPIPRTLHTGLVGIREISVIETPPEGRLPIRTYLQPFDDRLIREAVLRELDRDGQVYIVHNKVQTIEAMAEHLRALVPDARIVVAHGQMDDTLLEKVMLSFARQEMDVLLCSTIIENGLDIPNVNTIVVNNAHKLGLTQLYQLRGRVGRSANQAYAYLLYPRDVRLSRDASARMEAVFEAQDLGAGFSIAMKDLEIRGTGNLLGAEQSGHATAIGFDLYTRMIGDAVERLRGMPVEETPPVSVNLPVSAFLPPEYVGSEMERLTLYRRLAGLDKVDELRDVEEEMRDRFGPPPTEVLNLLTTVRLKILATAAKVHSVALDLETLSLRLETGGLYDRVSLYRKFGAEARVSNALLRIPQRLLTPDGITDIEEILSDMANLRTSLRPAGQETTQDPRAQDVAASRA